jgi:hypothetical protein
MAFFAFGGRGLRVIKAYRETILENKKPVVDSATHLAAAMGTGAGVFQIEWGNTLKWTQPYRPCSSAF